MDKMFDIMEENPEVLLFVSFLVEVKVTGGRRV
jgi:hypothetical protein